MDRQDEGAAETDTTVASRDRRWIGRLILKSARRVALFVFLVTMAFLVSPASARTPRPRVVPKNPPTQEPAPAPVPTPTPTPAPTPDKPPAAEKPQDETQGQALIAVLKAQNDALTRRLTHRLVNGVMKKEGMPNGAAGMNLYASFDHEAKTYTRNPDLWAQNLVSHLTGVALYNDFAQESYGGVLITPRHLLFCAHAHPHAHQTWGPNPNRPSPVHRFLTTAGRLVESTQLHQAQSFGTSLLPDLESVDLCVAVLDRDLEAEGLKVLPVFPNVSDGDVSAAMKWANQENQPFAFIGVSQGTTRPTNSEPPEPIAKYPRKHQRMCYIKDNRDPANSRPERGPFADWNYQVWDGDSGTATFLLLKSVPHLWMILTTAPGNGPRVGSHIDHVNALIAAADQNAVLLGRLEKPTGYTLRVGKLEAAP
jgi:hypothetical protein